MPKNHMPGFTAVASIDHGRQAYRGAAALDRSDGAVQPSFFACQLHTWSTCGFVDGDSIAICQKHQKLTCWGPFPSFLTNLT
jgi:hypothetical protein